MIQRYRLAPDGTWLDKATGLPMETQEGVFAPIMQRDMAAYVSPVTGKPVDGRRARREDLKRSNSREVDPSEWKPTYENKKYAEANKGEWEPRKTVDLGSGYYRPGSA